MTDILFHQKQRFRQTWLWILVVLGSQRADELAGVINAQRRSGTATVG